MVQLNRKEFITKVALISAGVAVIPKYLSGNYKKKSIAETKILEENSYENVIQPNAIIDLHCHPSLKMYLEGKKIWKRHWLRSPGANMLHMQEDVHGLLTGNVRSMLASHYLVEGGIERDWRTLSMLWPALKLLWFTETNKIEHEDYSNFTQINVMIDDLESQLHIANEKLVKQNKKLQFIIARNYAEFQSACNTPNTIAIAHSIEGSHSLGRNFPNTAGKLSANLPGAKRMDVTNSDPEEDPTDATLYIRNLVALRARGVCLMTLSHFFKNDLSYPVEGISPDGKKIPGMFWNYAPKKDDKRLRVVGRKVVEKMFDIGMIVDLTHSTSMARKDIYEINNERPKSGKPLRPLVFTHVGSQHIFEKYGQNKFLNYNFYNVSDCDITSIEACGGVLGVIPENFWLAGGDTHLRKFGLKAKDFRYGIPYIIETMKDINSRTIKKEYDNIGIGTDFDGLADNPKDLYLNAQLADPIIAMQNDPELGIGDRVAKITSRNTMRLLQNGWVEGGEL